MVKSLSLGFSMLNFSVFQKSGSINNFQMCFIYFQKSFKRGKIVGYFGISDVIDSRGLSLSQPFLAILATIAYITFFFQNFQWFLIFKKRWNSTWKNPMIMISPYLRNTSRITSWASFLDELIKLMIQSTVFPQKRDKIL